MSANATIQKFDAVVIGAGPGGYVCAIKLAQLGLKTAVIEKQYMGGVCLNVGCIPSKALIHAGSFYQQVQHHSSELGIDVKVGTIDLAKLKTWKDSVVKKLSGGVEMLLKANKVTIFKGEAQFESSTSLKVKSDGATTLVEAKYFVIASGSRPVEINGFSFDQKHVLSSTEALDLTKPPKRLLVIGGGYIGLELGSYYANVGSEVTVLEGTKNLLATMDQDCVQVVARNLKKKKVNVILEAKAKSYQKTSNGLEVTFENAGQDQKLVCDTILVTVGRRPNTETLNLAKAGLAVDGRGFISVDSQCRTKVKHIFAIGDVAGGMLLAHKASKEGIVAAEVIAGQKSAFDTTIIPAVVFTDPEIASVGLTLTEAKAKGFDAHEGQFPFAALGKALASGESEGFAKVVADRKTQRLLGVHIVGKDASSLLGEAGLALEMGAVLEDLARTIHAHPTLPESLMEAAEVALGHPIHVVLKAKAATEARV